MYKNKLECLLYNYITKDTDDEFGIFLKEYKDEIQKINKDKIVLKPVKKFLSDNGTDGYDFIYTTSISESWFDIGKYDFYINGKHINKYSTEDLIPLHFQGYLYLNFKKDIVIDSLLVVRSNLPARLDTFSSRISILDSDTALKLPYDDNFVYNQLIPKGRSLVIDRPYFSLNSNENIYDKYPNIHHWIYNNKITNILILDIDKGLINKYDDVIIEPMYLSVKNNSKIKMIIFYEGEHPDKFVTPVDNSKFKYIRDKKSYMEDIFTEYMSNPILRGILLDHRKELLLQNNDVDVFLGEDGEYLQDDKYIIQNALRNYDLFMEIYKARHNTKIPFVYEDWLRKAKHPLITGEFRERDMEITKDRGELLKFTFPNYFQNPFEIYFFNTLYQGSFIHDTSGFNTTIYINKGNLLDFYNITENDLNMIYGQILLRSHSYKRIDYSNIHKLYNGTLPISQDWFTITNKNILDNGIYLKNTDYELNRIHPSGMVCIFPKREQLHHKIVVTGYSNPVKITSNTYEVKVKNVTKAEVSSKTPNKFIYKGLFFTDYIDYRFNIYIGPYLLIENIDYRILSPNLIEFLKDIVVYKEDVNNETIEMRIEYEGEVEDILLQRYKNKSFRYRFFNNNFVIDTLYDIKKDISLITKNPLSPIYPKEIYDIDGYKMNMMMVKYFSSESLFSGDRLTDYGFGDLIRREFPQFIKNINNNDFIMTNIEVTGSIPRRGGYPSPVNLSLLIKQHVLCAKEMINQNKHFGKESYWDTKINYQYESEYYLQGDLSLSPNIPITYVIDNNL